MKTAKTKQSDFITCNHTFDNVKINQQQQVGLSNYTKK